MKFFRIIVYALTGLVVTSCNNDFNINQDWQDITIVYGLLNVNDSVHYIRVNKAFLGDESALVMAQEADSLFYDSIEVYLEGRKNGNLIHTVQLEKVSVPKDSGMFASNVNYAYKTDLVLNSDAEYKVIIKVPGKADVTGTTKLISYLYLGSFPPEIPLYSTDGGLKVKWTTSPDARLYELNVRFNYYEITATDTIKKSIDWTQATQVSSSLDGGESLEAELVGSSFLSFLSTSITPNADVIKRVASQKTLDFLFYAGSDDIYTYIQVSQPSSGLIQDKPAFTNIENGIGLFSSRYNKDLIGKVISDRTLDSLSSGIYTKSLKFANGSTTINLWSQNLFVE